MRYVDEPHTIVNGVSIHVGAISVLSKLAELGHAVVLCEDGGVQVERVDELDDNLQHLIAALDEDLALLLLVNAGGSVH